MYNSCMPTITTVIPLPSNSTDFERICRALFAKHWRIVDTQLNGISGQRQNGVDFYGTHLNGRVHGGQSKLHQTPAKLTEEELQDEVEKARSFQPKLDQYIVATTSRRDAKLQELARQITKDHRAGGLFEVLVYAWDDIVELLNEHGDVRDQYFDGLTPKQAKKIYAQLARIARIERNFADLRVRSEIGGHAEIEIAVSDLKAGRITEARQRLRDLQQRHWDSLSEREKYRVLANLGHCARVEEDFDVAGKLFLEAKGHLPEDENARYFEVVGYSCLGNKEKAFELANALRNDFPNAANANAAYAQTAPDSLSYESVLQSIPAHFRSDLDVLQSLSICALRRDLFDRADEQARAWLRNDADSWRPKRLLADILLQQELNTSKAFTGTTLRGQKPERLKEIISLLTDVLKNVGPNILVAIEGHTRLKRSMAYELLGQHDEASADLEVAYSRSPDDPDIARHYGMNLYAHGSTEKAINILDKVWRGRRDLSAAVVLADAIANRDIPGELDRAVAVLREAIAVDDAKSPEVYPEIWTILIKIEARRGRSSSVLELIQSTATANMADQQRQVLAGMALYFGQKLPEAKAAALESFNATDEKTPWRDRRLLAILLFSLKLYFEAFSLLKNLIEPDFVDDATIQLLESARQIGDDSFILDFCRRLRSGGVVENRCLRLEFDLLAKYNCSIYAADIMRGFLSSPTTLEMAQEIRTRLSILGICLGKSEWIERDRSLLPSALTVHAELGRAVVQVLKESDRVAAVDYAYEMLRKNFDSPSAWQTMFLSVGLEDDRAKLPMPKVVETGAAFRYREDDSGRDFWRIVESSPDPSIARDEVPPNHPLAIAASGKCAGEKFVLPGTPLQKQTATVLEVVGKFVLRFRQSLSEWSQRFAEPAFAQQIFLRQKADGTPDFGDMLRPLDLKADFVQKIENWYQQNPVPITRTAEMLGGSVIDVIGHFGSRSELGVRCSRVSSVDIDESMSMLRTFNSIVLDTSALATLFWLDCADRMILPAYRHIISEGTFLELRSWAHEHMQAPNGGYLRKHGEGYALVEVSPEAHAAFAQRVTRFISFVEKNFTIESGRAFADLPKDERDSLVRMFGQPQLESMLLSQDAGRGYWSDDLAAREISREKFKVRSTWTQMFVSSLVETGRVDNAVFDETTVGLVNLSYWYTHLTPTAVLHAATKAEWRIESAPLSLVLGWFRNETTRPEVAAQIAAQVVVEVLRRAPLVDQSEAIISRLLECLGSRSAGRKIILTIYRVIDPLFGLDITNAIRMKQLISAWNASHQNFGGNYGI